MERADPSNIPKGGDGTQEEEEYAGRRFHQALDLTPGMEQGASERHYERTSRGKISPHPEGRGTPVCVSRTCLQWGRPC